MHGGEFLESDGGDDLYIKRNEEDQGAGAQQQFTVRHFESREPGDPFTRSPYTYTLNNATLVDPTP